MQDQETDIVYPLLTNDTAEEDHIISSTTSNHIIRQEEPQTDNNELAVNGSTIVESRPEATPVTSPTSLKEALKVIILNTLPVVVIYFITFSIKNLSIHLLKNEHNNPLTDSIGIGNTLLNIIALALSMSFNVGLTSCSAQAYGAKNYQLVGFYLHRGLIINTIALVPGCFILYWSDKIAELMGFDPITSAYVQELTSYGIIGVVALMLFNTLAAYLNACDIFVAPAVILIISASLFWILSIVLIEYCSLQLGGVIISFNIMQVSAAILLFLYIKIKNPVPGSFFWFKAASFQGIWKLFKYEFMVGSMVFLEWICYEIIYLFSGKLGTIQVSAMTVVFTSYEIWYSLPLSLSDTVLTFVGNSVGEGNTKKAKTFLKAGLIINIVFIVVVELFYVFASRPSAEFYTEDTDVIDKSVKLFYIYLLDYPTDFTQLILSSGLRAVGKENLGFFMFVVCYYFLAMPLAYLLCFVADLEVYGLAYGTIVGVYFLFIWLIIAYWRLDWKKQVDLVLKRIKEDNNALP